MGAGENAETGVEAESVANRSMVGGDAGDVTRPIPNAKIPIRTTKPQNKISPTVMMMVRLFFLVIPLFYFTPPIAIIGSAGTLGRNHGRAEGVLGRAARASVPYH